MASSPKIIISEGEDYEIVQMSRLDKSTPVSAFKIDGTSAKPTFAQSPGGIVDSQTWDKPAADGAAATATTEHVFWREKANETITAVNFIPDATLTSNDTNYATITVSRRNSDGTNAVTIASISTQTSGSGGSGNWSQFVAVKLALTLANLTVTPGQYLTIQITKTGTGVVVPSGQLVVDYVRT